MKTVIISGIGPTQPLYKPLSKHFNVAVYDQASAQQLVSTAGEGVICPLMGATPVLHEKARNDAALLIGRVVGGLGDFSFSLDGTELVNWSTWLPGLVVGHFADIAMSLRSLDAYAKSEDVDVVGVITHEDVTPKFRTLALWARARDLPVIHVPHANCFAQVRPDIHDTSVADWILAASPYMRNWYVERGFSQERIRVVGFPSWDPWASVEPDKKHARRVLHIESDKPVVALCTGWPQRTNFVDDHKTLEIATRLTLQAAREQGWQLIWKLHPGDMPEREQRCVNVAARCGVPALVTRDHLSLVMQAADVVLSVGPSNVLVEAGLVNRPPMLFDLRGYGFPDEPPWIVKLGQQGIIKAVEGVIAGDKWNKTRDKFVKHYAFRNDGKATKRAVRQIKRIFNCS